MPEKKISKSENPYQLYTDQVKNARTRKPLTDLSPTKSPSKWRIPVSKEVILRLIEWLEGL